MPDKPGGVWPLWPPVHASHHALKHFLGSHWGTPFNGCTTPIVGMGDIGKFVVLPGPKPVLGTAHACTGLVGANNMACGNAFFDLLIGRSCFLRKAFEQVMNPIFTYIESKDIIEHFLHSCKRKVLPCMEVTYKALDPRPIAHGRTNAFREICPGLLPASTDLCVGSEFGKNGLGYGDVHYLACSCITGWNTLK